MRILGLILTAIGAVLIVGARVASIDLTEGQSLVQFWPYYAAALACFAAALGIILITLREHDES